MSVSYIPIGRVSLTRHALAVDAAHVIRGQVAERRRRRSVSVASSRRSACECPRRLLFRCLNSSPVDESGVDGTDDELGRSEAEDAEEIDQLIDDDPPPPKPKRGRPPGSRNKKPAVEQEPGKSVFTLHA